jgi:hypothetical protein
MAELTMLPKDLIWQTTLKSYSGYLYENCNANGNQKWVLPLKIIHRTRGAYGLQFCPSCLKNDGRTPYYRKQWRLSLFVACQDCGILLHDRCPFCDKPISFFRNELGVKNTLSTIPINYCYACKSNLAHSPRYPARIGTVGFQHKLIQVLRKGYYKELPYSIQYFEVLHQVAKVLMINDVLRNVVCDSKSFGYGERTRYLEHFSTIEREQCISSAVWMLENWPHRFIECCKEAEVYSSLLLKDLKNVPYWYNKVVTENLYFPNPNKGSFPKSR